MKIALLFCVLASLASFAAKGEVQDLSGSAWMEKSTLLEGERVGDSLKLVNDGAQSKTFKLFVLPQPGIVSPSYAISGQLKYDGVEGTGYLEMLNHFSGDKVYFTRTMAAFGAMRGIQGSSDWRAFRLPFYVRDESGWLEDRPVKLELNLVLPGKGTVYVRSVSLAQDKGENQAQAWWGARASGAMGGVLGGTMGVLGAITGILASRGKARGFVLGVYWGLLGVGLCMLAGGIIAVILHQPSAVNYTLLFAGGLVSLLSLVLMPVVRRRYQDLELRRMSSSDA